MSQPETALPGPRAGGRLGPFRHPAYTIYWAGGFVSNLGTWLQVVAGSVLVYQLTGSSLAVGFFNFAGFVPTLLFSVWGGSLSDRHDRRLVFLVTQVLSGAIAGVLAALTLAGLATEVHLVVATFLLNTLWAVGKPSLVAMIPNIVPREDLQDAVGLNSLQFIGGQIVGPALAALVMATSGAGLAFTINAVSYAGTILVMAYLFRVRLGGAPGASGALRHAQTGDGPAGSGVQAFTRSNTWVAALLVAVVASAAPMEIQRTLSPALVVEVLGMPESTAGIVVAIQSLGSAIALMLFMPIRRRGWSPRAAFAGYLFQGIGIAVVALAPGFPATMAGVACIGFGFSLGFPVLTAVFQEETPDGLRGRVMALHQMGHLGNRPFTALIFGGTAALLGVQAGIAAGLLLIPVGLLGVRTAWRDLARYRAAQAVEGAVVTGS